MKLLDNLMCSKCESAVPFHWEGDCLICVCGNRVKMSNNLLHYCLDEEVATINELRARDNQSQGYLKHSKFPIQVFRMESFLNHLPVGLMDKPALDLGCGSGPTTNLLLKKGYYVVAVDFSMNSLLINREINEQFKERALFVKADLNTIRFRPDSTKLIMACDFLQHLGQHEDRRCFLEGMFRSLSVGGWFYLSFFNFNIKNYFKSDIRGAFSGGAIKYERLLPKEIVGMFPEGIEVTSLLPMNIVSSVSLDRMLTALPGAGFLSRMMVIVGRRVR